MTHLQTKHRMGSTKLIDYVTTLALLGALFAPRPATASTISTGDGLSLGLDAAGTVSSLMVDGVELVSAASSLFAVRDLSAAGTIFAPNLVYNPGFEIPGGPVGADGWSVYLESEAQASAGSGEAAEGTRSLLIESDPATQKDGEAYYVSSSIPVTPGTRYRLSAQVKAPKGYLADFATAIVAQRNAWETVGEVGGLYVGWLDAGGALIASPLVAPLRTNARDWRRITGEVVAPPGAARAVVVVSAKLADAKAQDDAVWFDDVSMIVSPEAEGAVVGTAVPSGNGIAFSGSPVAPGAQLAVDATLTAEADRIEISGRVSDLSGTDRALELVVRLPAGLLGYRWWDSIRDARTVAAGAVYTNQVSAVRGGMLPISLYPLAALEDGARGLAAALPLDVPRAALLRYAPGGLEARFHVGLSPLATRAGAADTFALYLYRYDAAWGLRRALEKLRSMAPGWFETTRPIYDFTSGEQGGFLSPGACTPGCTGACEVCCTGASVALCHDQQNIASYQYTNPEGLTQPGPQSVPPPPYDDLMALLTSPPPPYTAQYGAMLPSLVLDGNGTDRVLKKVGTEPWSPNWLAVWALNMDPEIPGGYSAYTRSSVVDAAFATTLAVGAVLDGVQFDNFLSAPDIDLDPAHLALADRPLTYDPATYRPGIHTMAALHEHLAGMRAHVDATWSNAAGFGINAKGIGTLNFLAPLLDAFGSEGGLDGEIWERRMLDYRRALAYQKPLFIANQTVGLTVADAVRFTEEALLYGIVASEGRNGGGTWEPGAKEVFDAAFALLSIYGRLGWEPVTYATADPPGVLVERFGSGSASPLDNVYITVHNAGNPNPASYVLSVDASGLNIADARTIVVQDARTLAYLTPATAPGRLTVEGMLAGYATDLLRLLAPRCRTAAVDKAKLRLASEPAADTLRVSGTLAASATPPDFVANAFTLALADADGEVYRAVVPAGALVPGAGGLRFSFKDKSGTVANGLVSLRLKRKPDGTYRWRARAIHVDLGAADGRYLDVGVAVGSANCWADSHPCTRYAQGERLDCAS